MPIKHLKVSTVWYRMISAFAIFSTITDFLHLFFIFPEDTFVAMFLVLLLASLHN